MAFACYKSQILEERLAVAILITMYKEDRQMPRSILYSKVARSAGTTIDRVNEMINAGLIREEIITEKPYTKMVELTPCGREVAKKLVEIEDVINKQSSIMTD